MQYYSAEQLQNFKNEIFEHLLVQQKDHTLHLTLNRAEQKNALNAILLNELAFALNYAHLNPHIRSIIISAKGTIFCAGADLKAFAGNTAAISTSTIPAPSTEIVIPHLFSKVHKPLIANVVSPVLAGGLLIVGGCQYVVCTPTVTFSLPEVKRGLFPFMVLQTLLQIMPARKALDFCLLGKTLTATEALDLQLVTHLTDSPEQALQTAESIAQKINENAPAAIKLGLEAYQSLYNLPHTTDPYEFMNQQLKKALQTKDAAEGISAFIQKRQPNWTGE